MSKKRYYLAGPMSGIAQFNFPYFDSTAQILRARGYEIISPAELDDDETRAAALASPNGYPQDANHTWGEFLARDVRIVADRVDGIILLPGWRRSRGARLEAYVGILSKKEFMLWLEHDSLVPTSADYVMEQLVREHANSVQAI